MNKIQATFFIQCVSTTTSIPLNRVSLNPTLPVFSTWSMHMVTNWGTEPLSL